MALRWFEGFEGIRLGALLSRKYEVVANSGGIVGSVVGWQGKGFCLDANNNTNGPDFTTYALVSPVANSWTLGWAWRHDYTNGLPSSPTHIPSVNLHDSVGQQLQFEMVAATASPTKAGGGYWRLQVRRGTTVLGLSDMIFESFKWYYIEVKATIDPTTGSFEMRWWTLFSTSATVDTFGGATLTGINTANQGSAGADRVRINLRSQPGIGETYIDDIYIRDDSTYMGRQVIEVIAPSANGVTQQWDLAGSATNLQDAWDESATAQSTGEDDRRVTSDTTDEIALAAYDDLVNIRLVTVNGLLLHTQHHMDTSGDRDFVPLLRRAAGPSEFEGTAVNLSSTTYNGSSELFVNDPNTSSPWVIADINAYQFGVKTKT